MHFETPSCVGGRAGRLAKGRSLTLWPNCVATNATRPKGEGRQLLPEQAQKIQEASRAAALATGLFANAEEVARREFVELYPEAANAELAEASIKGLRVYVEQCPDREAMLVWKKWLRLADGRRAIGLTMTPGNRAGGQTADGSGQEKQPEQPAAVPTAECPPPTVPPAPEKMLERHFIGGLMDKRIMPLAAAISQMIVAEREGVEEPVILAMSEKALEMDQYYAIAEQANNGGELRYLQVVKYTRDVKGVMQCIGKRRIKKPVAK